DDNLEEIVQDGKNGYVFTEDHKFVSLVDSYIMDSVSREAMRNATIKSVQKYSALSYAKQVEAIYYDVLDQKK
ncbi:MAG: hypothetical protein K9L26_04010, partial [Candidatus Izimaplasma sp.]|nr:hypothetical protein [Candidatus Izimaplasma bacterium]